MCPTVRSGADASHEREVRVALRQAGSGVAEAPRGRGAIKPPRDDNLPGAVHGHVVDMHRVAVRAEDEGPGLSALLRESDDSRAGRLTRIDLDVIVVALE